MRTFGFSIRLNMKKNTPHLFLLILVIGVTLTFFGLIKDFLMACFWAVVLAILFHNLYKRIGVALRGRKNAAAGITLLIILLLVVTPVVMIGVAILNETLYVYDLVQSGELNPQSVVDYIQDQTPSIERMIERTGLDMDQVRSSLGNAASQITGSVAGSALSLTQNIFGFIVQFFMMLYILYYFLRDGRKLLRQAVRAIPLGDENEWKLINRFSSVARATVKGSLIVALTQGTIGGLLFWAVGIPGAPLWGMVMTILSLLPIGSGLVWGPAAVIFFLQGEIGKAVVIVAVGALIIGLIDNFLRPSLVGNDTKMPDYLVLLSTLGGLAWFGLPGFVLGPIIAALFVTCWDILGQEYR